MWFEHIRVRCWWNASEIVRTTVARVTGPGNCPIGMLRAELMYFARDGHTLNHLVTFLGLTSGNP